MSLFIMLLLGAAFGVVSAMFNLPLWIFFLLIVLTSFILMGNVLHTAYRSKNMHKIRKFIEKHKKDPVYRFMIQHADGAPDVDKIDTLEKVLAKYKQPKYQAIYGVHLAFVKEDIEAAKQAIKPLLHTEIGAYTNDIIHLLNGEPAPGKQLYTKQWMNDSITAHEAFVERDVAKFDEYVQKSLNNTTGVQLFGNYYSFQQMREKLS